MPEDKPTIDERIEALTHNLELAEAQRIAYEKRVAELDQRERAARLALLAGVAAYLRALGAEDRP